jgi:hypothetical protein
VLGQTFIAGCIPLHFSQIVKFDKCASEVLSQAEFSVVDHEFAKTTDPEVAHLGTTYDYQSIMHYQWNMYAIDKKHPTIKIRNSSVDNKILGTNEQLSPIDIIEINRLYNCTASTATSVQTNYIGKLHADTRATSEDYGTIN